MKVENENIDDESTSFDDRLMEALENEVPDDDQPIEKAEVVEDVPVHDPLEAPEFWGAEHKELFNKLKSIEAAEARQIAEGWVNQWKDQQKYITQKSQTVAEERRQYENQLNQYNQYQQALRPINEIWQANGIAPAVGVAQMAYYGKLLHTDPQALIKEVAKFANIDLNQVVEEQPYIDPHIQGQLRTYEQQLQQLQQFIGQSQQEKQQQSVQAINNVITNFIDLTDGNGKFINEHLRPESPYRENLEREMAQLMTNPYSEISQITDQAQKLQAAYTKAINYIPEIQALKEKEQAAARQAEVQKAKQASVRTNSKSKDAPAVKSSFDDQLKATLGIA